MGGGYDMPDEPEFTKYCLQYSDDGILLEYWEKFKQDRDPTMLSELPEISEYSTEKFLNFIYNYPDQDIIDEFVTYIADSPTKICENCILDSCYMKIDEQLNYRRRQ